MFGYVTIDKPELKFREFDVYRACYCGLCRELREKFGIPGQLSLTYDETFVILVLEGLYEPRILKGTTRCAVHPVIKRPVRKSVITEYAADMNIFLVYYKCMDDWMDEKKAAGKAFGELLKKKAACVRRKYPEKCEKIGTYLDRLSALEKADVHDLDMMAGCFGHILEEIFAWRHDLWEADLRRMGFYLGKYIYLLDAYEDLDEDLKNGSYNVLSGLRTAPDFEKNVRSMLAMMMAESCRSFERLPVVMHAGIIRNILYSGVWTRYRAIQRRKEKEKEKEHV